MNAAELFNIVTTITEESLAYYDKRISKLSNDQLNWKPNPGTWSVHEVLAHLNSYASFYHPTFSKKISNTRFTNAKEAFLSSPLGRSAWKSMKLGRVNNIKRKFKAPKEHNPSHEPSLLNSDNLKLFKEGQEELLSIFEAAKNVNLRRVKIPISISKIVRLRLGDALLFVVYHNQRHMQQIKNLIENKNFPKK